MKRTSLALAVTALLSLSLASAAGAAEQHPPKFGVDQTQCTGESNQPNCPGSH